MSKELENLKTLVESSCLHFAEDLAKPIENALEDVEKYKNIYLLTKAKLDKVSDVKLKLEEVLEIIKKKNVNTFLICQCKNYIEYNKALANQGVVGARHLNLTKEEFDLLKEVLGK